MIKSHKDLIVWQKGIELVLIAKKLSFGQQIDYNKAEAVLEEVMKMLNTLLHKLNLVTKT